MAWLLHMKATKMRKLLQQARADHLSNYRARLKVLYSSIQALLGLANSNREGSILS